MIISAFPCCGKTYAAKLYGLADLDSFDYISAENWENKYIEDLTDAEKTSGIVFITQRAEILSRLSGVIIVCPYPNIKDEWIGRILKRGYKPLWLDELRQKWYEVTSDEYLAQFKPQRIVRIGPNEYLSDLLESGGIARFL